MSLRVIFLSCFLVACNDSASTRSSPETEPEATVRASQELVRGTPEEVGMSSEQIKKIDDVVQEYIDAGRVHGVVVGVTRRNKVVYYEAHGVIDPVRKTPMPKDALFAMASSTKPILGVAAMMLIEEGTISLDDPVEKYIPEFKGIQVAVPLNTDTKEEGKDGKGEAKKYDEEWLKENWDSLSKEEQAEVIAYYEDLEKNQVPAEIETVPANRPITIHDLLTHTAGLHAGGPGSAGSKLERGPTETLASFAPRAARDPLDFQPGTKWAYSGTVGLDIVARIIEIASGTPFDEFVQTRIFDPLDMKDTHWNMPEGKQHRYPTIPDDKGRYIKSPYYFSGSVGLLSTARDYMHFEQMLVNKGTLFGHQLLKPESVEMMSTNKIGKLFDKSGKGVSGLGFGYTVGINMDPELAKDPRPVGAFGWGGAAGTVSWSAPSEQLTFVYMVMGPTDLPTKLAAVVSDAIVE
ncbi:MAG: serine hydrolase domain-containing protein [Woeseiaceae bacterium]